MSVGYALPKIHATQKGGVDFSQQYLSLHYDTPRHY